MDILVTDREEGPAGWEMIPVNDINVFYNPKTVKEGKIMQLTEDFANGDMDEMYKVADFDTELDREWDNL
jgi:hypothetical protein